MDDGRVGLMFFLRILGTVRFVGWTVIIIGIVIGEQTVVNLGIVIFLSSLMFGERERRASWEAARERNR